MIPSHHHPVTMSHRPAVPTAPIPPVLDWTLDVTFSLSSRPDRHEDLGTRDEEHHHSVHHPKITRKRFTITSFILVTDRPSPPSSWPTWGWALGMAVAEEDCSCHGHAQCNGGEGCLSVIFSFRGRGIGRDCLSPLRDGSLATSQRRILPSIPSHPGTLPLSLPSWAQLG